MPTLVFRFVPYSAMALFPFILVKHESMKRNKALINHELIHIRQQLELLVIPFYVLYFLNYILNLFIYRNHYKAYRQIVFEREAYAMDGDLHYLKRRELWAFLKWLSFR